MTCQAPPVAIALSKDLVKPGMKCSPPALAGSCQAGDEALTSCTGRGLVTDATGAAPGGSLAIRPPSPSATSSGSNGASFICLWPSSSQSHTRSSNSLKTHAQTQKSHMQMCETINSALSHISTSLKLKCLKIDSF